MRVMAKCRLWLTVRTAENGSLFSAWTIFLNCWSVHHENQGYHCR